jgi:hypothetical protein
MLRRAPTILLTALAAAASYSAIPASAFSAGPRALSPAVLEHIHLLGYTPGERLLQPGVPADTVLLDGSDGRYSAVVEGRRQLASTGLSWPGPHEDVVVRLELRFEGGSPAGSAGIRIRDSSAGWTLVLVGASDADRPFLEVSNNSVIEGRVREHVLIWSGITPLEADRRVLLEVVVVETAVHVFVNGAPEATADRVLNRAGSRIGILAAGGSRYSLDGLTVVALDRR